MLFSDALPLVIASTVAAVEKAATFVFWESLPLRDFLRQGPTKRTQFGAIDDAGLVVAPGPGHALQMSNGRLVVSVWYSNAGGHAHRPSCVGVIYSDDHGASWHAGELVPPSLLNASETAAVQLADGRVALFIRNEAPTYRHAVSFSTDGATGWTTPIPHPDLYSPISFATAIRFSGGEWRREKESLFIRSPRQRNEPSGSERLGRPTA